jgi:hypothetical protein
VRGLTEAKGFDKIWLLTDRSVSECFFEQGTVWAFGLLVLGDTGYAGFRVLTGSALSLVR